MTSSKSLSSEEKLACSIDALPLRTRAHGTVRSRGIKTVGELVETDARELLSSPGCGKKTVGEIVTTLKMVGFQMANSEGLFTQSDIDNHTAEIKEYYTETRKASPKIETYKEKLAKEIMIKQLMVMLMRVNGTPFSAIAKGIGRTESTARVYFTRFSRTLVREAEKRRIPVTEILTEKNIPLAAIELMKKDGIRMLTCNA